MYRPLVIICALILDLMFGDPPNRFHPVALMGRWLSAGHRLAPGRHRFWFGAGWALAGLLLFTLPWRWLRSTMSPRETGNPAQNKGTRIARIVRVFASFIASILLLKPMFAYRNLRQHVADIANALAVQKLDQARYLLGRHLVSRDTGQLTPEDVAGAAIESLAENLTDSIAAPLLSYTLGGLPAAWGYRFINTADAMWGYRTAEFEHLGKFPARLDDILNWLPARLTGWLLVAATWLAGENAARAKQVMLTQHRRPSSPNAGWTMSAVAGALGVTLSKQGVYQLTGGPTLPKTKDVHRALRIADICLGLVTIVLTLYSYLTWRSQNPD